MTSVAPSLCNGCMHLRPSGWQCQAFPTGIPRDMLIYGGDHHEPRPEDHGVQFEQAGTEDARAATVQWERTFGPS